MSRRFYAWKDKNCNGVNPEWVELNYQEFKKIMEENKKVSDDEKRWFYKLPGLEEGDDYLVMECTLDAFRKSQSEKQRRTYNSSLKENFDEMYSIISFDLILTDKSNEEYTLHEIIPDESVNVAEEVLQNARISSLYEAISHLDEEDKEFILYWLSSKFKGITDVDFYKQLNISKKTFRYRFSKICNELKKFF